MPNYERSGTENLRANETVKAGSTTAAPSGSGKDMGGTENLRTTVETKAAESKSPSTYAKDSRPAGVQSFNGEAV